MSASIMLLFERGESVPKPRVARKWLQLDLGAAPLALGSRGEILSKDFSVGDPKTRRDGWL